MTRFKLFRSPTACLVPALLGILCGFAATTVQADGVFQPKSAAPWLYAVGFAVLFPMLFEWMARLLEKHPDVEDKDGDTRLPDLRPAWRPILIGTGILMACWLPWMIAAWPGILWWDTSLEVAQALQSPMVLWAQHPLLDSLVYALFARIGLLFGNVMVGLYLLALLTMLANALMLTMSVAWTKRIGSSNAARIVMLGFIALFPFFGRMFSTIVKDTLFTPFFLLFALMVAEIIRVRNANPDWPMGNARMVILLIVAAVGTALTRSNGLLIVIGTAVVLCFAVNSWRHKIVCLGMVILSLACLTNISTIAANAGAQVVAGRPQEPYALPMQQVAAAMIMEPQAFTPDETAYLQGFYNADMATLQSRYHWQAADYVKDVATPNDFPRFTRIWVKHAFTSPTAYTSAALGLWSGWLTFPAVGDTTTVGGADIDLPYNSAHRFEGIDQIKGFTPNTLGGERLGQVDSILASIPLLQQLMSKMVWASMFPAFILFLILRRPRGERFSLFVATLPMLLAAVSLYVAPTSQFQEASRYLLPIICAMPMTLSIALHLNRKEDNQ